MTEAIIRALSSQARLCGLLALADEADRNRSQDGKHSAADCRKEETEGGVIRLDEAGDRGVKQSGANRAALAAVRPGVTAGSIDDAGRAVINAKGYGQYFTHRIGHGLGLEEHEEPYMFAGNPVILEPGMCFSDEPGIYLPEWGGVRIEDDITVTADAGRSISDFPRELRIL